MVELASQEQVMAQAVDFRASWWERYVPGEWWPQSLVRLPGAPGHPGYQRVTRQDLFDLAAAAHSPEGRVGLLLGCYLWGTGPSAFLVGRRARTFTRTPLTVVAERLARVDEVMATEGPVAAYASMTRGGPNAVAYLGPAFFTKYLYFTGADLPRRPLILDRKVAAAFGHMDPPWNIGSYGWGSVTYERYLHRAEALAAEHGVSGDAVEHGLFTGRL
ncbi:8-oxoguanine DNA glycosylase OGG fold protein [Klenkia taihuensis]|nr:hypothetical protein [Klenkia taihuensis]GHE06843.1 hypothetical protein GCM10011381_00340 [Klenkia taihuensis]